MSEVRNDPLDRPAPQGQTEPAAADAKSASKPLTITPDMVTKGLGWFSIALGVVELLAPQATKSATGVGHGKNLLQAYGVREIATGIGLLTAKDPQPWLWARVAGDALDIATLATDLASNNDKRRNTAISMAAVLGVTALDLWAADAARRAAKQSDVPTHDYRDRVGMALSPDEMRGKARDAMQAAPDMQMPSALKPYTLH